MEFSFDLINKWTLATSLSFQIKWWHLWFVRTWLEIIRFSMEYDAHMFGICGKEGKIINWTILTSDIAVFMTRRFSREMVRLRGLFEERWDRRQACARVARDYERPWKIKFYRTESTNARLIFLSMTTAPLEDTPVSERNVCRVYSGSLRVSLPP